MSVFCMHICAPYVCSAYRSQKSFLELQLNAVGSYCRWWELNLSPL